jgi:hypothetical protein
MLCASLGSEKHPNFQKHMAQLLNAIPADWPASIRAELADSESFTRIVVRDLSNGSLKSKRTQAEAASSCEQHPVKRRLLQGFILYALDDIHAAHSIFQDEDGFFGSYGHGMMHRREGDFWNANYWFRRAGNSRKIPFPDGLTPAEITAKCEAAQQRAGGEDQALSLLHKEWVLLLGALLGANPTQL